MKAIVSILQGYQYEGTADFFRSLFPSFKYTYTAQLLCISSVAASVELLFGFKMWTFVAFVIAAVTELVSGIYASVWVRKEKLESGKFSRFAFKLILMLTGLYIVRAFNIEWDGRNDLIHSAFDWLYSFLFVYGALEYLISIMENKAVIEGKPKDYYSSYIKEKLDNLFNKKQL